MSLSIARDDELSWLKEDVCVIEQARRQSEPCCDSESVEVFWKLVAGGVARPLIGRKIQDRK